MNERDEQLISQYIDGELLPGETEEAEKLIDSSQELSTAFRSVGNRLRKMDPAAGMFNDVDLFPRVRSAIAMSRPTVSIPFWKYQIAGIAAALIIAFLLSFALPLNSANKPPVPPPRGDIAYATVFKSPGSSSWKTLDGCLDNLFPGTLVRAEGDGFIRFEDGSSRRLSQGTIICIGGSSEFPYTFQLLEGDITADIHNGFYRVATQSAVFTCSEALFELRQGPASKMLHFPEFQHASLHSWQWGTSLTMRSGVVESGSVCYTECNSRLWTFDSPSNALAAMLEK